MKNRDKIVQLARWNPVKVPDIGPLTQCERTGDDVCDELNCHRDCAFLKALGWTPANAA